VGIAENKTLAKIGSDLKKPDGLVVIIHKNDINDGNDKNKCTIVTKEDLYNRLKLTDIPGIGHRQEKNLNALGIKTLKDLKNYPKSHLITRFGRIAGHHLYHLGQLDSTWKANVQQEEEIKSMGHMYTLPLKYRAPEFFVPVLYKLCEMVGRRLRRKQLEGNIVHFYSHDKNYQGFGGSEKIGDYISDSREIFIEAVRLFEKFRPKGAWGFKLIGITVANLRSINGQLSLFGHKEKVTRLSESLDRINDKYGEFTVIRAPILAAGKVFRDSVGFGRIKEL
jgi:DNA polymerase IV